MLCFDLFDFPIKQINNKTVDRRTREKPNEFIYLKLTSIPTIHGIKHASHFSINIRGSFKFSRRKTYFLFEQRRFFSVKFSETGLERFQTFPVKDVSQIGRFLTYTNKKFFAIFIYLAFIVAQM